MPPFAEDMFDSTLALCMLKLSKDIRLQCRQLLNIWLIQTLAPLTSPQSIMNAKSQQPASIEWKKTYQHKKADFSSKKIKPSEEGLTLKISAL